MSNYTRKNIFGGDLTTSSAFKHILSIGYEYEIENLIKLSESESYEEEPESDEESEEESQEIIVEEPIKLSIEELDSEKKTEKSNELTDKSKMGGQTPENVETSPKHHILLNTDTNTDSNTDTTTDSNTDTNTDSNTDTNTVSNTNAPPGTTQLKQTKDYYTYYV